MLNIRELVKTIDSGRIATDSKYKALHNRIFVVDLATGETSMIRFPHTRDSTYIPSPLLLGSPPPCQQLV